MNRFFVTGDTHMNIDIKKLNKKNFPTQRNLTKDDYLIVCGDFGMVWSNSAEEMYWRKWLHERNYTTLWVDGNHENFDLLEEFPVEEWNGGKVQFINESIIHLMRGQVYNINGVKFFTMGGASSTDKESRREGKSWWKQELPTYAEIDEAIENLNKHNWEVDYVITHTTSNRMMTEALKFVREKESINKFFDMLHGTLKYKEWYFGHFHEDRWYSNHRLIFNDVLELKVNV